LAGATVNAGVENAGVGKPILYTERPLSYFLTIVLRFLSE